MQFLIKQKALGIEFETIFKTIIKGLYFPNRMQGVVRKRSQQHHLETFFQTIQRDICSVVGNVLSIVGPTHLGT
jgi:hypothetical protein